MSNILKIVSNILKYIGIIALCVLCFIVGRWGGCRERVTTEIRWDTLRVEKPIPYEVEKVRTEYVYVPTPADTVVREVVRVDSVLVAVDIERREYRDSLYRAVVSGAVVGDIHPTLDEIEVYARSETKIVERSVPMFRPYISACGGKDVLGVGGGVNIKGKALVGAKYMRIGNDDAVVGEISWTF